jgi:hypothetical protein
MKYKQLTRHHVRQAMTCARCSSEDLSQFGAEVNFHFPGHEGLTEPTVWVFPQVVVCFDCGYADFSIPGSELQRLADGCRRIRAKAA